MTDKPSLPARAFDPWPRMTVDTSTGSDFHRLNRIAGDAATMWAVGPDGAYAQHLTLAQIVDGAVHEALLHLLELGFLDIDHDRMNAAPAIPMHRERNAP